MKHVSRLFALLMMLCLMLSFAGTAFADTCTVRVFAGAQGTVDGGTVKTYTVERGEPLTIASAIGEIATAKSNSKYYPKGIRVSGAEETHALSIDHVNYDQDFVVTYGIKNTQVKYYVRYVDTSGNTLRAQSGPFTANAGDRVYVAYVEIAGYTPDALNRVRTLTEDYTFTFTYTRTTTTTTTTTTTGGGGGGGAVAAGAAAGGANAANANAANANAANQNAANQNAQGVNNAANQNANAATPANPGAAANQNNGPLEIIDEDEVPLARPDFGSTGTVAVPNAPKVIEPNSHSRLPTWALVAAAVLLLGLITLLYWYLLFYRKKKKYAGMDEDYEILDYDDDEQF